MLILPYIHNIIKKNNIQVNIIKLFTVGGKQLWEEDNTLNIDNDILNSNDIYRKGSILTIDKKIHLCEIDTEKTKILDFYKWEEIEQDNTDIFCWRTYIYLVGYTGVSWLDIPESERLGSYSVKEIIKMILHSKLLH